MNLVVFLVEDSPVIRSNLISALNDMVGAVVVQCAAEEDEAIAWLQSNNQWNLAVVDLLLESGSGLGVLRALKGRAPHQKAVILTNYATPAMRAGCLAMGADRVFDKSIELDEFFEYCALVGG